MLDIVSIAADLLADMPEFVCLNYFSEAPRLYQRGGAMERYTRLMEVESTPFLLLGVDPDAPENALRPTEARLHVYAGGISWSGTATNASDETIRWESYTIPPEILKRVAGREPN